MRAHTTVLLGVLLIGLASDATAGGVKHMRKRGLPGARVMAAAAMRSPAQKVRAADGTSWSITRSVATDGLRFTAVAEADNESVVVSESRDGVGVRLYRFKRVPSTTPATSDEPFPAGVELVEVERRTGDGPEDVVVESASDGTLNAYLRRLPRDQRTTRVALARRAPRQVVDQIGAEMAQRADAEGATIATEVNGVWLTAEPGASAASVRAQYDAYWSSPRKKAAMERSNARAAARRAAAVAKAERAVARLARKPGRTGQALLDAIERDAAAGTDPAVHAIRTLRHPAEIREYVEHLRGMEPQADRDIGALVAAGLNADGTDAHWQAAIR
jgi:hypothetical protein